MTFKYLYVPGQGSPNIPLLLLIIQLLFEHNFEICDVTLFKQFVLEEIPDTKQVELSCLPKYAYETWIDWENKGQASCKGESSHAILVKLLYDIVVVDVDELVEVIEVVLIGE